MELTEAYAAEMYSLGPDAFAMATSFFHGNGLVFAAV